MRKIYSGGGVMAENFFNRPFLLFQCRLHFVSFMFNYRGRSFHQLHKSTISVPVLYPRRIKASNFDNFLNLHQSFLWPEYFIVFLCERWIPCDIRLDFTFQPRDSTLQYKKCLHLWNKFPCICTLMWRRFYPSPPPFCGMKE